MANRTPVTSRLPHFPWDQLAPVAAHARHYPGGAIDLSQGTPADDTPGFIQTKLANAANSPRYPQTSGHADLRQAIVDWFHRIRHVRGLTPDAVIPTVGSKELVAWLPTLLGIGAGHRVAIPSIAYPTYRVGAQIARADVVEYRTVADLRAADADLVWVNSPSNPTGSVLDAEELRSIVQWARSCGAIVVSDECYATLPWHGQHISSLLSDEVCDGDRTNLLVAYSLSKQSSLAGYRAGLLAGDEALVSEILAIRKHAGLIVPGPIQDAMTVALGEDAHVADQREIYVGRLEKLRTAFRSCGYSIHPGAAGLYLWVSHPQKASEAAHIDERGHGWDLAQSLADQGIVVTPGSFYGDEGRDFVRVAATATDRDIDQVVHRLVSDSCP